MISTSSTEGQNCEEKDLMFCITYSSSKLGPRLIGNAKDWGITDFSKETMYNIIHDSLLIRNKKGMLFVENIFGEVFRVYILKYKMEIIDYRFHGDCFAICIFVPKNFKRVIQVDKSVSEFNFANFISSSGSIKKIFEKLKVKVKII